MIVLENELLNTIIGYLKGVGPKRAELLNKEVGIYTFRDLLHYFPFRYVDRSKLHLIKDITKTENEVKTLSNELLSKQSEFDAQIGQLQESRKPLLNVTTSLVNELRKLDNEVD